jgi:hypothetical protein
MLLLAIGAGPRKSTIQHAQLTHPVDVELLPSVRRATAALTADLIAKQTLHAGSNAVVVRLDDPRPAGSVHELEETFVNDCADEFLIHEVADRSLACVSLRR